MIRFESFDVKRSFSVWDTGQAS